MEKEKNKTKTTVPVDKEGRVGVRATLKNMGFSDGDIGYDEGSGTVTLGGKNLLKPGYLDDNAGISYAKESDIQKSVAALYRDSSDPVVRVSDAYAGAAGRYGLTADALTWGNDSVNIGGKPLEILYLDEDGKSWARQSSVEQAVEDYAKAMGVQDPMALAAAYAARYLSKAEQLANSLSQRKAFSYQPEKDPVFLAYRQKYLQEGQRASREALADYASLTGGYVNSAAATAAAQAQQYYGQQLTNMLPELEQQAYLRYVEDYQADAKLLDQMVDLYDRAYQHAAKANQTQIDYANNVALSNVKRDLLAKESALAEEDREREWKWTDLLNGQKYRINDQSAYWDNLNQEAVLEGLHLDNIQKKVYQQYYEALLQSELDSAAVDRQLKQLKLSLGKV